MGGGHKNTAQSASNGIFVKNSKNFPVFEKIFDVFGILFYLCRQYQMHVHIVKLYII